MRASSETRKVWFRFHACKEGAEKGPFVEGGRLWCGSEGGSVMFKCSRLPFQHCDNSWVHFLLFGSLSSTDQLQHFTTKTRCHTLSTHRPRSTAESVSLPIFKSGFDWVLTATSILHSTRLTTLLALSNYEFNLILASVLQHDRVFRVSRSQYLTN